MEHGPSVVVFISQIVVLLIAGRVAGESMQRIGQPPVIGQIIAGIVVGPSVLGIIAPGLYHNLFPDSAEQKAMLDAVAQLGILLLLLMTGMETDLSVFRDVRRPVISISLTGIVVPFICGVALGMLLPDSILPSAAKRLITALFLGVALSISSVKIVAMVDPRKDAAKSIAHTATASRISAAWLFELRWRSGGASRDNYATSVQNHQPNCQRGQT